MSTMAKDCSIVIELGDITTYAVDAIVNAANRSLQGGGGVDGAIHHVAGPELLQESAALAPCETGQAVVTRGYRLPAKFVIHTVGPVWRGGSHHEADLLYSCYATSLALAGKRGFGSIAFPAISTGVYKYPLREAAEVAFRAVTTESARWPCIKSIYLVCFDEATKRAYEEAFVKIRMNP